MTNPECIKCNGSGFIQCFNPITGNTLNVPCLCIPFSKKELKSLSENSPSLYSIIINEALKYNDKFKI